MLQSSQLSLCSPCHISSARTWVWFFNSHIVSSSQDSWEAHFHPVYFRNYLGFLSHTDPEHTPCLLLLGSHLRTQWDGWDGFPSATLSLCCSATQKGSLGPGSSPPTPSGVQRHLFMIEILPKPLPIKLILTTLTIYVTYFILEELIKPEITVHSAPKRQIIIITSSLLS